MRAAGKTMKQEPDKQPERTRLDLDEEQGMTQGGTSRLGREPRDMLLRKIHERPPQWSRSARIYMVSTKESLNKTQGLGTGTRFRADSGSRQQTREVLRLMTNKNTRDRH